MRDFAAGAAALWVLAACGKSPEPGALEGLPMSIKVTSPAFTAGAPMPKKHAYKGEGQNVSPALNWSGTPPGAKEFALICDDPDAPRAQPWVHWVVYKIPATAAGTAEGSAGGGVEGSNDFGERGYGGPMPPPGHGVHHYHFKIFALCIELKAAPGLTKDQLLAAMKGHILAQGEIVGTYERKK